MDTISCFKTQQGAKRLQSRVTSFFDRVTVSELLNASGIRKTRGATSRTILPAIFQLAFEGAYFYRGIALNSSKATAKGLNP